MILTPFLRPSALVRSCFVTAALITISMPIIGPFAGHSTTSALATVAGGWLAVPLAGWGQLGLIALRRALERD